MADTDIVTPVGRRFLAELLEAEQRGTRSLPGNWCHASARMRLIAAGLITWAGIDRVKLTDDGRRRAEEEAAHG